MHNAVKSNMRRVALSTGAAVAAVGLATWPAYANTYVYDGSDYAGVGADARWVEVCDKEEDGNGVLGEFRLAGGGILQKGDANGSAGGCGNTTAGVNITDLRVCEGRSNCNNKSWQPWRG